MVLPLDIALMLLSLVFVLRGAWVGLIRQIASISGLVFGFLTAGHYYTQLSHFVLPIVKSPQVAFLLTFLVLFIIVYLSIRLLGLGLKKVIQISLLSWFDRVMGGIFGLGKAYFVAVVLFIATTGILGFTPPFLQQSILFPTVEHGASLTLPFIQDQELRKKFLPQKPAINKLFQKKSE